MYTTVYICFIYLALSCAFYLINVEAIEGEKLQIVEDYKLPFVVSIGRKNVRKQADENHICTGVLITKKYVLTAAHCLFEVPSNIQVTLGKADLWAGKKYDISNWITFNQWAAIRQKNLKYPRNDIAILALVKPIRLVKIKPVKLSLLNNRQIERTEAIVAGFGIDNNGKTPRFLLSGHVKILAREECEEKARKYTNKTVKISESHLCSVAEPYILTGSGDSGGPLLNTHLELVGMNLGIVSKCSWYEFKDDNVDEFLKKHKVNAHASVDFYREFINDYAIEA